MARVGRKPLPLNVLVLRGSRHAKGRVDPRTPDPVASLRPPAWLELSPAAKVHWLKVGKILQDYGLLTPLDLTSFAMMSETWGIYQQARQALQGAALLADDARGANRPNPLLRVLSLFGEAYRKSAKEFLCTPAARDRIDVSKLLDEPMTPSPAQGKNRFFHDQDA